jgi:hypothetical protein
MPLREARLEHMNTPPSKSALETATSSTKTVFAIGLFSLLILISSLMLIPFTPNMPGAALDSSWQYALNVALTHNLIFGRDVVFTFGPLGPMYTKLYSPETDTIMMVSSAIFGIACSSMFALAAFPRKPLAALAVPLLVAISWFPDPFFITLPFMLLLNVTRTTLPSSSSLYLKPTTPVLLLLTLAVTAVGMETIVKGSFTGVIGPICLLMWLILARRSISLSIGYAALLVISVGFWWVVCGQPLSDLPNFFIAQSDVISGYTEAMSISNSMLGPIFYLLSAVLICFYVYFSVERDHWISAVALTIAEAWTLFVAFKAGFVRHDAHALIAAISLLFAGYAVACLISTGRALFIVAISVLATALIAYPFQPLTPRFALSQIENAVSRTIGGITLRVNNPSELPARYAAVIRSLRDSEPLPQVKGTVDIYPVDLSAIFANQFAWAGRPIFQSYSAYTPALLKRNADHLLGQKAPENIFFALSPIDNRLPSMDDSTSLLILLAKYRITGYYAPFILMKKADITDQTQLVVHDAHDISKGWNQDIYINNSTPTWASIDVHPSILGRIAQVAFKAPMLEIDLTLTNGAIARHRYIPEIGRTGFIISPYIATATDFIDLAAGIPTNQTVKSFKLVSNHPSFWNPSITVKLASIDIAPQTIARSIALTEPTTLPPRALLNPEPTKPAQCSIDFVNGLRYRGLPVIQGSNSILSLQGWIGPPPPVNANNFDTWVVVSSATGEKRYFKMSHQERPDVAAVLNRIDLKNSGFSVMLDMASFSSATSLRVFSVSDNASFECTPPISLH